MHNNLVSPRCPPSLIVSFSMCYSLNQWVPHQLFRCAFLFYFLKGSFHCFNRWQGKIEVLCIKQKLKFIWDLYWEDLFKSNKFGGPKKTFGHFRILQVPLINSIYPCISLLCRTMICTLILVNFEGALSPSPCCNTFFSIVDLSSRYNTVVCWYLNLTRF